ncbi:hypothetical protein HY945_05155 [Candidatus Gottesmanbacteria bacterium]|nr:hypothetical protein [Candidatus Gottesmanbacteria bacterium]
MKKDELVKINTGVDDPLIDPTDDCLDRDNFAKRIFILIDNTPIDSHLRVGILGDWGSGKTTAMNFIKHYCQEKGHPVAMFHPWQFHSREDAWKGFVASLDRGLAAWKNLPVGNFRRKRIIKDFSGKARKLAEIADTKIGKAIAELILSPLENLLNETKKNVSRDLKNILQDKRLYIFIDDLDRAEPEIVYDMLMLLNEIFDLNQCIFIIGLDTKTVSDVLKNKLGYINSKDFLDKIINWPFELPMPSNFDWNELLAKELSQTATSIIKDAINAIKDILPKNPRKFKHYLRYLNSLHKGFLSRFAKDELDWKLLYLAQLLRIEFPDVFKSLMQDAETVDDIATGILMDKQKDVTQRAFGSDKKEADAEWEKKVKAKIGKFENIDTMRFLQIYEALRNCGGFTTPERVKNHLLVIEVPELMTWSEYNTLKQELISLNDSGVTEKLKKFIAENRKDKEAEKIREFIKMLLREREQIWSNLIDLHSQEEMKPFLEDVDKIMRICSLLLDIDEVFAGNNPIFDRATFEEWFGFLSKWFHFKEPKDLYGPIRGAEEGILLKMINKNLFRVSEISEWLSGKLRDSDFMDSQRAFTDTRNKILEALNKNLAEDLLKRFERQDGIKELWPSNSFVSEKRILLKDGSSFHTAETHNKLKELSEKAKENIEIQKNFVEALRMLCYGATDGIGWATQQEVQKLINKKEFFGSVWNGATCRPLNRRLVGSLEDYIKSLSSIVTDDKTFERPRWWLALTADKASQNQTKEKEEAHA